MKTFLQSCSIILFCYLFFSCSYTAKKSLKLYQEVAQSQYDVIIVPGVPFENDAWSKTMKGRILWAKFLYDKGITNNIMYSGSAVYSPFIEAEVMALYGEALGVDTTNIYKEIYAEHSTENLYYGYQYAKKLGFEKIALASDPFQSKLLKSFAKRIDPSIGIIPMVYDSIATISQNMEDPSILFEPLRKEDFISIKDREGFWKRLKGTAGKSLKEGLYD